MAGVTIKKWYERVNAVWPTPVPPLTEEEARRAAKRLWRWGLGVALQLPIEITSGRRYTWTYQGTLRVNASGGWDRFIHDMSHLLWRRANPGARPHEKGHAKFELAMRKEVLKRGWLDGVLKKDEPEPEPPPSKLDERRLKHERTCAAIERWEKKLLRAQKALVKLRRKEVGLRRHLESAPAPALQ